MWSAYLSQYTHIAVAEVFCFFFLTCYRPSNNKKKLISLPFQNAGKTNVCFVFNITTIVSTIRRIGVVLMHGWLYYAKYTAKTLDVYCTSKHQAQRHNYTIRPLYTPCIQYRRQSRIWVPTSRMPSYRVPWHFFHPGHPELSESLLM